jgi:hypothetical protein
LVPDIVQVNGLQKQNSSDTTFCQDGSDYLIIGSIMKYWFVTAKTFPFYKLQQNTVEKMLYFCTADDIWEVWKK